MTDRITAAEARKLAGPTVDERVDDACLKIRARAENGKRSATFDDKFWANSVPVDYKTACDALRTLGFQVRFVPSEILGTPSYTVAEW